MNSILRPLWVVAALAVPVVLSPAVSRADAAEDGIHVRMNDLDLSRPAAVNTLYDRIHVAAVRYCESIRPSTGSRISARNDACVTDAVNNTVKSLNLPSLTALHADRGARQKRS